MIRLYACGPMSASITERQCAINRESHVSCLRCAGLGELVAEIAGELLPAESLRVRTIPDFSVKGSKRRNVALVAAVADSDHILPEHEVGIVVMETVRTISFDVVDIDDLALIGRVERLAYANGSTLGDEILLWLQVMDEGLRAEQAEKRRRVRR